MLTIIELKLLLKSSHKKTQCPCIINEEISKIRYIVNIYKEKSYVYLFIRPFFPSQKNIIDYFFIQYCFIAIGINLW